MNIPLTSLSSSDDIELSDVYYVINNGLAPVYLDIRYREGTMSISSNQELENSYVARRICESCRPAEFERLYPTFMHCYNNVMYP